MRCYLQVGGLTVGIVDAIPECSEDYCQYCDTCLGCHEQDNCNQGTDDSSNLTEHTWVKGFEHADEAFEFAAECYAQQRLREKDLADPG